jgi:SAM-dependent methyltransferase
VRHRVVGPACPPLGQVADLRAENPLVPAESGVDVGGHQHQMIEPEDGHDLHDNGRVSQPYYRDDLAYVHDQGFGFHAEGCAPGLLALLEPVRQRQGVVLEIGCGSGLLTKLLVGGGHRVVATDASAAMLELTRAAVPGAERVGVLALPDDPVPAADAIVGVGHALNYLPDAGAVERALVALARALRPGGLFALDLCDLAWGTNRIGAVPHGRVGDDWAIVTRFSQPSPDRFDREITTFVRQPDGAYRRDEEFHRNVLIDTAGVPALLRGHGVTATIGTSFADADHPLPAGLVAVVGTRA